MLKWVRWIALAGWAGLIATGWWLASVRMASCPDTYNCRVHEMATRDAFLITGLLLPFLIVVGRLLATGRGGRGRYEPPGVPRLTERPPVHLTGLRSRSSRRWGVVALCSLAVFAFSAGWLGSQLYAAASGENPAPPAFAQAATPYDAFSAPVAAAPSVPITSETATSDTGQWRVGIDEESDPAGDAEPSEGE